MPTRDYTNPIDLEPRRWAKCLKITRDEMIAGGWNKHAGKFTEVSMRKARKLFSKGGGNA